MLPPGPSWNGPANTDLGYTEIRGPIRGGLLQAPGARKREEQGLIGQAEVAALRPRKAILSPKGQGPAWWQQLVCEEEEGRKGPCGQAEGLHLTKELGSHGLFGQDAVTSGRARPTPIKNEEKNAIPSGRCWCWVPVRDALWTAHGGGRG